NDQRVVLVEAWRDFECGSKAASATFTSPAGDASAETRERVTKLLPSRITKRRQVAASSGESRWEQYTDFVFPDDDSEGRKNLTILERAKQWKEQQERERREKEAAEAR